MKEYGIGAYNHSAVKIDKNDLPFDNLKWYNKASKDVKHLIMRTWCWNPVCTTEYSITEIDDWDKRKTPSKFAGLKPQGLLKNRKEKIEPITTGDELKL